MAALAAVVIAVATTTTTAAAATGGITLQAGTGASDYGHVPHPDIAQQARYSVAAARIAGVVGAAARARDIPVTSTANAAYVAGAAANGSSTTWYNVSFSSLLRYLSN